MKNSVPWAPDQGHPVLQDGGLVLEAVKSLLTCERLKIFQVHVDTSLPSWTTCRLEVAIDEEHQIVEGAAVLLKVSGEAGKQVFEFVKVTDERRVHHIQFCNHHIEDSRKCGAQPTKDVL